MQSRSDIYVVSGVYAALFYRKEFLLHYVGIIMSTPKIRQTCCFCPDVCLSVHPSPICVHSITLQLVEGFSNSLMQMFTTLKWPWSHPELNNPSTPGDIRFLHQKQPFVFNFKSMALV